MSLPAEIVLLAGLALIATAALWYWLDRRRREADTVVRNALADEDPYRRMAAVAVAAQRGVGRNAAALLDLARHEPDPGVLEALARAVAIKQWEPSDRVDVVELRLWAQSYFARQTVRDAPSPSRRPIAAPVVDDETPTVLVTGAGGPAGIAVIQELRARGIRVVAADADETAAGLALADESGLLPQADDAGLVDQLCELATRTKATALISTVSEELRVLASAEDELAETGLATWLPSRRAIETCIDKWSLAQVFAESGVSSPASALVVPYGVPGPWIVKPRFGRGSRDVYTADSEEELGWILQRVDEPVVQTRLEGLEFTVDALVDRDGELAGGVPRWRLETKAGISTKGRTFDDDDLLGEVETLLGAIGLQGPSNVQGFVQAESGTVSFVEVNPRFSGGLPISLAAGADLVGEYLRAILGHPIRRERLQYRAGVQLSRYLESAPLA